MSEEQIADPYLRSCISSLVARIETDQDCKIDWSQFKTVEPSGFITGMCNIIKSVPNTHPDWHELVTLSTISLFSINFRIDDMIGDNYSLVTWSILNGPSRMSFKSSSVKCLLPMVKMAGEKLKLDIINPDDFTCESLIMHLATRVLTEDKNAENNEVGEKPKKVKVSYTEGPNKYPINYLFESEIGAWFQRIGALNYQTGLPGKLCQIYDNEDFSRQTMAHSLHIVKNPYLVMLGCSTPETMNKVLDADDTFFTQGFGNRIAYVMMSPKTSKPDFPHNFFVPGNKDVLKSEIPVEHLFLKLYKHAPTVLEFDEEAKWIFKKYYYDKQCQVNEMIEKDPTNKEAQYVSALFSFALKYSGLHCVNRVAYQSWRDNKELPGSFLVNGYDILYGIGLTERILVHFRVMMKQWKVAPIVKKSESNKSEKDRIVSIVRDSPNGFITRQELTDKSGKVLNPTFLNMMETLTLEERLREWSIAEINSLTKDEKDLHKISYKTLYVYSLGPKELELSNQISFP